MDAGPIRPLLGALLLSLLLAACGGAGEVAQTGGEAESGEGPRVVSTVAPITDMVRQVLGGSGELTGLVPDGVNSHTFEPAPGDARTLGAADLMIANGLFLEEPSLQLAEANMADDAPIVTLADGAIDEQDWAFDFSFPAEEGIPNPHLWLDVAHAMDYVEQIRAALAEVDPDRAEDYRANAEAYLAELEALHGAIGTAVATIPEENRRLVTYHDSWPYFGQRYGMEVIGAVQPSDFAEPSAAEVRTIIEQVREARVPAVFGSEVFPSQVLQVIADETGARYVEELSDDELPGQAGDPEHSYIGMMVANVRTMVEELGGDPAALAALAAVDGAGR